VTVEANPNDLTPARVEGLRKLGVNRLSIGVQSFHEHKLQRLERTHSATAARETVARLVADGWNVSIDLMFGLAGESAEAWRQELQWATESAVSHISTYNLTIEKGTMFWNRQHRGEHLAADEDRSADLYEAGIDAYWQGHSWLGLGPGAASFVQSVRWRNHRSPSRYLKPTAIGHPTLDCCDQLSAEQLARERLIFGLRQLEGVDIAAWEANTGFSFDRIGGATVARWVDAGLLSWTGTRLALTRRGLLVSDALWPELI
jgi:oxygen-independent coproporphyrinogen-3 oxidase